MLTLTSVKWTMVYKPQWTHTQKKNQKQITHGNNNSACLKLDKKAYRSVKSIKTSLLTLSEINLLWVLDK